MELHKRVLIADDEISIRDLLSHICIQEGYDVDSVCDGEAAYLLMNAMNGRYGCVFLDLQMPNWDGASALESYRGDRKHIYIVTGFANESVTLELLDHPCVAGIIAKPFNVEKIKQILRSQDIIDTDAETKAFPPIKVD